MSNEQKYFDALKLISKYGTIKQIYNGAEKQWGLSCSEALEMTYENMQEVARRAIKGKRRPKDEVKP
jgi:hypothetical protein